MDDLSKPNSPQPQPEAAAKPKRARKPAVPPTPAPAPKRQQEPKPPTPWYLTVVGKVVLWAMAVGLYGLIASPVSFDTMLSALVTGALLIWYFFD